MTILTPHLGGWRSDDGYSFTVWRRLSGRAVGELTLPDGSSQVLTCVRHETAADLLMLAEREIVAHRAGVAI